MLLRLFLLFTIVPLLELMLLLEIGGLIGLWPTIAIVIGTGFAGAWLARREGGRSWRAVQSELAGGQIPGEELLHGLFVMVAAIVLVTPGVLTDLAGLALLVRPVRGQLIAGLKKRFESRLVAGPVSAGVPGMFFWSGGGGSREPADSSEIYRLPEDGGRESDRQEPLPDPHRRPRVIEL